MAQSRVRSAAVQRPLYLSLIEATSLLICGGLQIVSWTHLTTQNAGLTLLNLSLIVAGAVSGWLIADFTSGVAHFMADNLGTEATPVIGRLVIAPFREHHAEPEAMLKHGFLERNGNSALISLVAISWVPFYKGDHPLIYWLAYSCLWTGLWVLITNQIHAWAHQQKPHRLVRGLQTVGLLLSPQHHGRHHAAFDPGPDAPRGSNYCITSGFCDRFLNPVAGRYLDAKAPKSATHCDA